MNLPEALFSAAWLWAGNLICFGIVVAAFRRSAWSFFAQAGRQHVFFGAAVACMLLWTISGSAGGGLQFHLLGTTVLTLMFGAPLAFLASVLALAGITIAGLSEWGSFGLNAIVMGALPVAVSHAVYRLADTRLPNHFFVYVLVSAFVNGGFAMAASRLGTLGLSWLKGTAITSASTEDYLLASVLLSWGEALLSGMLMTILVVYRPAWVISFDDARYIVGR